MTLQVMQPIRINEANIDSTNLALEVEYDANNAPFALGDQVRVDERIFEAAIDNPTDAPGNSTQWFDAGPANRYAPFDLLFGSDQYRPIETKAINADSITYTLSGMSLISGIAMFGLQASEIRIVASLDTAGDILDQTYTLPDANQYNGSMWRWLFIPQSFSGKFLNFDLNIPVGSTVEITITNTGSTAEVAAIAMGIVSGFGSAAMDMGWEIVSRGVFRTEGALTSLLKRTPSERITYPVTIDNVETEAFQNAMRDIESVATVFFVGDEFLEFAVYGVAQRPQLVARSAQVSKYRIEVLSL